LRGFLLAFFAGPAPPPVTGWRGAIAREWLAAQRKRPKKPGFIGQDDLTYKILNKSYF
jgi:hypothetical protein